jgi:hypothetical protein
MDNAQKAMIEKLESMPLEQARQAIATGKFYIGEIGSSTHNIALAWLADKEALQREVRDVEMLSINRKTLDIMNASQKKKWYVTPFGIILLGTIGSLIAAGLLYFFVRQ